MSINRGISHSKEASNSLDRQLSDIQQSLSRTHHAILSQTSAVNCILHSILPNPQGQNRPSDQPSPPPGRTGYNLRESCLQCKRPQSQQRGNIDYFPVCTLASDEEKDVREVITKDHSSLLEVCSQSGLSPEPMSLFEGSAKFFPETYSIHQRLLERCLIVISSYEESFTGDCKTNMYRLIYMKSPRKWCRLRISLKISSPSIYWAATNTTHREERPLARGGASLPSTLQTKMQAALLETELVDEDTSLCFLLSAQDSLLRSDFRCYPDLVPGTTGTTTSTLRDARTFLEDLGCPRFYENQVTQIRLLEPPNRFASCVNGILVYETMFVSEVPSPELVYNIRLLHCMDGTPGFARLVGIVMDTSGKQLKSYLVDFPRVQSTMKEAPRDASVSWGRREKWARQLIEGVSQVHSQGFVAGALDNFLAPTIDISDNVNFRFFKKKFRTGRQSGCYYPPEFHHYRSLSSTLQEAECPDITSKTDIFHLGLRLWFLAEGGLSKHRSPVCMRGHCDETGLVCDESHIDPIALPRLNEDVPKYFRDVVDACRARNPEDRPPARRLLELFPSPNEDCRVGQITVIDSDVTSDIASAGKPLSGGVSCNRCRHDDISARLYHCCVCARGDFDICQGCYDAGRHCLNKDHLLVELRNVDGNMVPWRYHSWTKSSGKRDIVEL
ncbi:MAG: hypothetical protein L6R39_001115 [Caloplaca ligustica]|nr:MAG: hypothetical protein L6R39_001115 [Caloplaca ligustica]